MMRTFCTSSRKHVPTAMALLSCRRYASSTPSQPPRFLITGGLGQVGTDLWRRLVSTYGKDSVIVTDVKKPSPESSKSVLEECHFRYLDVLNADALNKLIVENNINTLVHNSAIMSVLGESIPHMAMDLNINGVRNVLESARTHHLKVFIPSTMAVFNEDAGKVMTKDTTILNPTTVYGITKVFMEQIGDYYHRKYNVDFRSLRYPGIISAPTLPGGGTTDYMIHMYHSALRKVPYVCPLRPEEPLPMLYIDDCIDGTIQLLEAPREQLRRCVYNISGFSVCPSELLTSINKHVSTPLELRYEEGLAQSIAHSWPDSMDDTNAREQWGWKPQYDLDKTTKAMLELIPKYHAI